MGLYSLLNLGIGVNGMMEVPPGFFLAELWGVGRQRLEPEVSGLTLPEGQPDQLQECLLQSTRGTLQTNSLLC